MERFGDDFTPEEYAGPSNEQYGPPSRSASPILENGNRGHFRGGGRGGRHSMGSPGGRGRARGLQNGAGGEVRNPGFHDNNYEQPRFQHRAYATTVHHPQGNMSEAKHLSGAENYASWSFVMKAMLIAEGLWKVVCGLEVDQDKNDLAVSKLCLNVKSEIHSVIYGMDSAKQMWDKLHKAYGESGLISRCSILRTMFRSSLDQFASMNEYIDHLMRLQQRLVLMKKGLEDQFLAVVMLSGLTIEYEPIVMTLESDEAALSSDLVRSRLLTHDSHRNNSNVDNSCALATSRWKAPSRMNQSASKQIICFHCNKPGHKKPGCPELQKKKKGGPKPARAHLADNPTVPPAVPETASLATVSTTPAVLVSEELA